jgi:hypothetical protein
VSVRAVRRALLRVHAGPVTLYEPERARSSVSRPTIEGPRIFHHEPRARATGAPRRAPCCSLALARERARPAVSRPTPDVRSGRAEPNVANVDAP